MDATPGPPSDGRIITAERQAKPSSKAQQVLALPIRPSREKQPSASTPGGHSTAVAKTDADAPLPRKDDPDAMEVCDNDSSYSLPVPEAPQKVSNGTAGHIPIQDSKPVHTSGSFGQGGIYSPRHLSTSTEAYCAGSCRKSSSPVSAACSCGNKVEGSTSTPVGGTGDMMGMGSWCPEAKEIKIKRSLSGDSTLFEMN